MNIFEKYILNRALNRIFRESVLLGSCHSQLTYRRWWNPMRWILGSMKYKFFHPTDVICRCDWTSQQNRDIWDRYGRDKQ